MKLIITEKPSVAMEFAKALKVNTTRKNGYLEGTEWIITWCVGNLVTMSYPEKYDENLKKWRLETRFSMATVWCGLAILGSGLHCFTPRVVC